MIVFVCLYWSTCILRLMNDVKEVEWKFLFVEQNCYMQLMWMSYLKIYVISSSWILS